jgi:hypothetical protein
MARTKRWHVSTSIYSTKEIRKKWRSVHLCEHNVTGAVLPAGRAASTDAECVVEAVFPPDDEAVEAVEAVAEVRDEDVPCSISSGVTLIYC